jgi:hypothetical protein
MRYNIASGILGVKSVFSYCAYFVLLYVHFSLFSYFVLIMSLRNNVNSVLASSATWGTLNIKHLQHKMLASYGPPFIGN